ncbi:hypothetical protein BJ122_11245 [Rhodopseudomonas faecalis]|uniref:Uncharacterized protein n=1 Tax=Rhodopseudomonas faecalis TaxID=99655 RepID=A0A318TCF1_9BRAD|nr:hypothetical protein BJ122_11245 [Rhodopseudomonas faecalis]
MTGGWVGLDRRWYQAERQAAFKNQNPGETLTVSPGFCW